MFANVIVVDSFFEDPESIVELALKQKFYTVEDNPNNYKDNQSDLNKPISYLGARTLSLNEILDKKECYKINNKILSVFSLDIPNNCDISINADISCLFHALFEEDKYDDKWIHQDSVLYAGIIYLNKNLESETYGTLLNGEIIPYKFNRLILYRADSLHAPMNGYGKEIDDSRLTLNIFINRLTISLNNKLSNGSIV
jgi:hypothetical protein